MSILNLVRIYNLLIACLGQWLLYYQFIYQTSRHYGLTLELGTGIILLLSLCTALIMAGGNVYNDLTDVEADRINKAGRMIVGVTISPGKGRRIYLGTLLASLTLALWLSWYLSNVWLFPLISVSAFFLYAYSRWFRLMPILGNITVAFLCGMTVWIIPVAAVNDLKSWQVAVPEVVRVCLLFFGVFGLFAFLGNWIREMVKDMEDRKGDKHMGWRSVALTWPSGMVKAFILILFLIIISTLIMLIMSFPQHLGKYGYLYSTSLIGATLFILVFVIRANEVTDYQRLNRWMKMYLVLGLLFVIFWHV